LRSLEEFRKNLCVKIPPNSPCANLQSLAKFKNPIFILKGFFFNFRPSRPSSQPAHSAFLAHPAPPTSLFLHHHTSPPLPQAIVPFVGPLGPHAPLAYSREYVFFFDSHLPTSTSSLSPLTDAWAPLLSSLSHPALADPGYAAVESRHVWPPRLEWPPSRLNSPRHHGPSLTPVNLALSSIALRPLTLPLPPWPPLPGAPSAPITGDENP
jgi:hypothetical protein